MKARRVRTMAVAIAIFAVFTPAPSAARQQSDMVEIRLLEASLVEALHARDRQRLESLLATDYVLRGAPDINRETWLQNALTLCWGDRSDLEHFRARRHDDVAIVSFELTFYVDPGTCRPAVLRSLVTDVWVRDTGEWKLKVRHAGPPAAAGNIAAQYGVVPEPPPVWEASSEFSAVATGGNTSTRTLGLSARVAHRSGRHRTQVHTRFLTSQADEVTNARSLLVEGRHSLGVTEQFQMFGDMSYGRDRFAGIKKRVTATAGVGYAVAVPAPHTLSLEGGVGWTLEQRVDVATLRFATATGALNYKWTIRPGADLQQDATVHADLESAGNWRTSNTTALTVSLTRVLSLRASHAIDYRHRPVPGFRRSDMRTAVTLVLAISRRPPLR